MSENRSSVRHDVGHLRKGIKPFKVQDYREAAIREGADELTSRVYEVGTLRVSVAILAQGDVLYGRFSLFGTATLYDLWHMFFSCPDGYSLVCGLHGHSLRPLVCSTGTDFKGLEQAARRCRRSGFVSSRIAKNSSRWTPLSTSFGT